MAMALTTTDKAVTLVVPANATSEYGHAPAYASFSLTQALLDRIQSALALCKEHGLTEVRFDQAAHWGPGEVEQELRLRGDALIVQDGGTVWVSAYPKYGDYFVESPSLELAELRQLFDSANPGDVVVTADHNDLLQQYEENQVGNTPA